MEINSGAKLETSAPFDSLVQTDECKIIALENRMMFFSLTFFDDFCHLAAITIMNV